MLVCCIRILHKAKEYGVEVPKDWGVPEYTGPPTWLIYEAAQDLKAAIAARNKEQIEAAIEKAENLDQRTGVELTQRALRAPAMTIANNAGKEGTVIVGKVLENENAKFKKQMRVLLSKGDTDNQVLYASPRA